MSPYLFCLVMDAFSNLLEERGFKGITINDYTITHLLYADDVIIFGEASIENCNLLASILKDFAAVSGLQVNYEKSALMFPKYVHNQSVICNALSIQNKTTKITYLGIPLSFYRLKMEDYMPLVDSINKKLTGWKANILSPISLKWDHWADGSNLVDLIGIASMDQIPDIMLSKIIYNNAWRFPEFFTPSLIDVFSGIHLMGGEGHCLIWYDKEKTYFKNYIDEFYSDIADCSWYKMVWHKRNALKFSVFAWLANVGGLKTADALRIRNISVPIQCSLCYNGDESVSHIYFECPFSFNILIDLFSEMSSFLLRPNIRQVYDWINGKYHGNLEVLNFYKLVISTLIYFIWKERNNRIFGKQFQCHKTLLLCIKRAIFEKTMQWKNDMNFLDRL
ncbi:Putative ribonuclease H protein [Dendrobium catenatum]|uniref:Ribonuclease H protein n=1 Tax=Dendrobium catenatum TaxID=906689 RepID=A0A2I0VYP7_9ASPA|nr:Putative ribonuclease H protein [Dendrobium catenatum]